MASPNLRCPNSQWSRSTLGRNMPLMGRLPWLWVAGGNLCCVISPSTNPLCLNFCCIFWDLMSSFMSPLMMTTSPLSCHSWIALARSVKKQSFGESVQLIFVRYLTCCWYVESRPEEKQGWYAETSLTEAPALPLIRTQLHHPKPNVLPPECITRCESWLMMSRPVLPGWWVIGFLSCLLWAVVQWVFSHQPLVLSARCCFFGLHPNRHCVWQSQMHLFGIVV